jgi:hypothetical protein
MAQLGWPKQEDGKRDPRPERDPVPERTGLQMLREAEKVRRAVGPNERPPLSDRLHTVER